MSRSGVPSGPVLGQHRAEHAGDEVPGAEVVAHPRQQAGQAELVDVADRLGGVERTARPGPRGGRRRAPRPRAWRGCGRRGHRSSLARPQRPRPRRPRRRRRATIAWTTPSSRPTSGRPTVARRPRPPRTGVRRRPPSDGPPPARGSRRAAGPRGGRARGRSRPLVARPALDLLEQFVDAGPVGLPDRAGTRELEGDACDALLEQQFLVLDQRVAADGDDDRLDLVAEPDGPGGDEVVVEFDDRPGPVDDGCDPELSHPEVGDRRRPGRGGRAPDRRSRTRRGMPTASPARPWRGRR